MNRITTLAALAALTATSLTSAPALAAGLSLADAVRTAASEHPDAKEGRALAEQAAASVRSAQAAWDPTLTASTSWSSTDSARYLGASLVDSQTTAWDNSVGVEGQLSTGTTWSVSTTLGQQSSSVVQGDFGQTSYDLWTGSTALAVSQDLLAPFRSSDASILVRQAHDRLDQAELTAALRAQSAIGDTAGAWWTWRSAVDEVALATRSLEQARELEARTRVWFEEGEVARLELDRVTAERLGAERDLLQAQTDARRTADDLLVLLGRPVGSAIEPVGSVRHWSLPELDEEAILALARDHNPDLRLAQLELDAARQDSQDARVARLPTLDASASVGMATLNPEASYAAKDLWTTSGMPTATVGLSLGVPLGGRAAAAQRDSAAAQVLVEEIQLRFVEEQLEADVRAALAAVRTASQSLDLAEARLQVARSTEAGEQARVDEGVRRLDELLDAVQQREAAELDRLQAEITLAQAELQVANLLGTILGSR